MYFYFDCDAPAVLKIDGMYRGKLNGEKHVDVDGESYIELCPTGAGLPCAGFFPDEDFLSAPPENFTVTDLAGGFFVYYKVPAADRGFKILAQKKYPDASVTAFIENGLKLSIETPDDFYAESLDFIAYSAEIFRDKINGKDVFIIRFGGKKPIIRVYSLRKTKLLFSRGVDEFVVENGVLYTTEKLCDVAKHEIKSSWTYCDSFSEKTREVVCLKNFSTSDLCDGVLPYVFLEEFAVKGDYIRYLSDDIKKNAEKLSGFFGNFLGVCPPPFFRDYKEIGLIKKRAKNAYYVDYFLLESSNGKIFSIKKL